MFTLFYSVYKVRFCSDCSDLSPKYSLVVGTRRNTHSFYVDFSYDFYTDKTVLLYDMIRYDAVYDLRFMICDMMCIICDAMYAVRYDTVYGI